jgi:SAM-dependent methyltransferase
MTGRLKSITQTQGFAKNLNILEVGAGYAWMCRAASEFLPESYRVAQDVTNELSNRTPWVSQYFVNELDSLPLDEATKFQVVSMTHVLEHIINPKDFLIQLKKFLSPDGLVFITMPHRPNGSKSKKKTWESWSYHHVPAHLQYFSKGSLDSLLKGTGLEISYWNTESEGGQASELHLIQKIKI